jgi:DNA-binding XRE family transcriptional regulator
MHILFDLKSHDDYLADMTIETQSAVLRAMRAWANIEQSDAAAGAGLSVPTLIRAERGRACTAKTWAAMLAFYAAHGMHWREGDELESARIVFTGLEPVLIGAISDSSVQS